MIDSSNILPKRQLYIILIVCSIIILSISLDTLIKAKDIELYIKWKEDINLKGLSSIDTSFEGYITKNLVYFFSRIIVPLFLSLNTYFAYTKTRVNKLFIIVWSMLVIGSLIATFLELSFHSVFYYINIILYVILLFTILSLIGLNNKNNKGGV